MILVGQISTPTGSLSAVRRGVGELQGSSASYYAPKLSTYTVDVLMDRNAVQGHGVQGW